MPSQKPIISIVMPVYNAQSSVERAISSVMNSMYAHRVELIVVDDCSTDDTAYIVKQLQQQYASIRFYQLRSNSGSPSGPRNLGIKNATSDYLTFMDDDDIIDTDTLVHMTKRACRNNHDLLKGYLYVIKNGQRQVFNRLHEQPTGHHQTLSWLIAQQSTRTDFIVKKSVLVDNHISYDSSIKIGEDTIITAKIMAAAKSVAYINKAFYTQVQDNDDINNPSSTQRCDDREINDQLTAWETTQSILVPLGIDYYKLRLHVGLRNLLISIVRYSNGVSEQTYNRLSSFAVETKSINAGKMSLHTRYSELYQAILAGDYQAYLTTAQRRLLIAGYDLKFVLPLVSYLEKHYHVQVDEWTGHNTHDKKQSEILAKGADIIWCEWLLGNAVFFSQLKNNNQKLVIRAHRFELEREFGHQLDYSRVDMVLAVGQYYQELFAKTFNIPEQKMRLLHNYVEDHIYTTQKSSDYRFNLGMVGILPHRKGFYKGLQLLKSLREKDDRFKLHILGKAPHELSWIKNNPKEQAYFKGCDDYIAQHKLQDSVIYGGYRERHELYTDIGYILSLSHDEREDGMRPESFHLSIAEGAVTGSMGLLLDWQGVEHIYPKSSIFLNLDSLENEILKASQDAAYFDKRAQELRQFVLERYRLDVFLQAKERYMKQLWMM